MIFLAASCSIAASGIIMIFVLMPHQQEFITRDEAIKAAKLLDPFRSFSNEIGFGFLKYNGSQTSYPQYITFQADPHSGVVGNKTGIIILNAYEKYSSSKKIDRYVWILYSPGVPGNTDIFYVDAESGEIVGVLNPCPMCVCLSGNTSITTPNGNLNVKDLKTGNPVWTEDKFGNKQLATIVNMGKTHVPSTHFMVHLVLDDGRELYASQGHPTADGRFLGNLKQGDYLDNSHVKKIELVQYDENYTYDILPSGQTGFYWANGILVGSTLK